MTYAERRKAALDKCSEVCNREYGIYLDKTQAARDAYFAELKRIEEDAESALRANEVLRELKRVK